MKLLDPALNRPDLSDHTLVEDPFAVDASEPGGAALMVYVGDLVGLGKSLVHGEDVAVLGMAGVAPALRSWVPTSCAVRPSRGCCRRAIAGPWAPGRPRRPGCRVYWRSPWKPP